jgi:2TM domain
MSKKIKPTGKQVSMLMVHAVVFTIATVASLMMYQGKSTHWVYPWPAWSIAAWGLIWIGHFCIVFMSYEDAGYAEYRQQQGKK